MQVGPKKVSGKLHCLCTHLSAFGGDFFVAPNPIDFDKVWSEFGKLDETGNFVVLATVCSILALYLVALVFARRVDKRDCHKVCKSMHSMTKCPAKLCKRNFRQREGRGSVSTLGETVAKSRYVDES